MSTNCERRRDLGAVQLAEATSSYSTSAVSCCAHSEQLNMSRSQPGVPVRAMSYSRIARPQLGHAGVLPTGCSDDLNKLNWGIAPLLARPTNSQQRNLFRDWFCRGLREQLAGAHVRFGSKADICSAQADVRFVPKVDIAPGSLTRAMAQVLARGRPQAPCVHSRVL
jgi:hypothetical protein